MSKRMWVAILLSIPLTGILAQDVATDQRAADLEHSEWIQRVLRTISDIKPGMPRRSLSPFFKEDGGLQTRLQGRYVYRHCQYIKIDVEFSGVDEGTDNSPDDKIVKVSRPYLEYPVSD